MRVIGASAVRSDDSFIAALSAARAAPSLRVPHTVSAWELLQKLRKKRRREFSGAEVLVDTAGETACTQFRGAGDLVNDGCYAALPKAHPIALAALERAHSRLSSKLLADHKCWSAWAARAWCQLLLGRPQCAAVDGMECQERAPFEPDGYGVVAEACLEMGGAAEARVHILNALSANAADDRLHYCLQTIETAAKLVPPDADRQPEMSYSLLQTSGRGGCGPQRVMPHDSEIEEIARTRNACKLGVQISQSDGRGVVLLATQNYSKGEELWTEVPVVSVCLDPNRCQRCMLPVEPHDASKQRSETSSSASKHEAGVAVLCDKCGEVFCSKHCLSCANSEWHGVQCGATSRRIAQLRQTLWSERKAVEHHYHVLVAARLSALALSRCILSSGDVDVSVLRADCTELNEYYGVDHLVGLGDDATPDILQSNVQPFAPIFKQYKLFCSITGLGGASEMPAGRRFGFEWYQRIFGICVANSMQDHIGGDTDATPHVSLCAKGSLSNHSCNPNAGSTSFATTLVEPRNGLVAVDANYSDTATGTGSSLVAADSRMQVCANANAMVFRARRPIHSGEEINVTYISETHLQARVAQRRTSLRHYLFSCRCGRCEAEDAEGTRAAVDR